MSDDETTRSEKRKWSDPELEMLHGEIMGLRKDMVAGFRSNDADHKVIIQQQNEHNIRLAQGDIILEANTKRIGRVEKIGLGAAGLIITGVLTTAGAALVWCLSKMGGKACFVLAILSLTGCISDQERLNISASAQQIYSAAASLPSSFQQQAIEANAIAIGIAVGYPITIPVPKAKP